MPHPVPCRPCPLTGSHPVPIDEETDVALPSGLIGQIEWHARSGGMAMVEELQFSQAKARLSAVMDEVVHRERVKAVRRDRGTGEIMYLIPRGVLHAALGTARVAVDYLPDEEGVGIWVNGLEIGAHGADVEEARRNLVGEVRAYVANFLGELPVYLTWPDRARLMPQVLRLAVARDDAELARILFDAREA